MPYTDVPATLTDARARWADADLIADDLLTEQLAASWARCVAFVPAEQLVADTPTDAHLSLWREATVLDCRELWTAFRRDGDVIGFDTYAIRVRPLSDAVRSLLRPRTGLPMVG